MNREKCMYSRTSNKGPSEKRTTSQQRDTFHIPNSVLPYEAYTLSAFKKKTAFLHVQGTKWLGQNVLYSRGSTELLLFDIRSKF